MFRQEQGGWVPRGLSSVPEEVGLRQRGGLSCHTWTPGEGFLSGGHGRCGPSATVACGSTGSLFLYAPNVLRAREV